MTIMEKVLDVLGDDGGFMDAVFTLPAGDGLGGAGVDTEFETEHGAAGSFGGKRVPVIVNNGEQFGAELWREIGRDLHESVKLRLVQRSVPLNDIGTDRDGVTGVGTAEGFAAPGTNVKVGVNIVVAEVKGNVSTRHFGAPDFGRSSDGVGAERSEIAGERVGGRLDTRRDSQVVDRIGVSDGYEGALKITFAVVIDSANRGG